MTNNYENAFSPVSKALEVQSQKLSEVLQGALTHAIKASDISVSQGPLLALAAQQTALVEQISASFKVSPLLEQVRKANTLATPISPESLKSLTSAMTQSANFQKTLASEDQFIKLAAQIQKSMKVDVSRFSRLEKTFQETPPDSETKGLEIIVSDPEVLNLVEELQSGNPDLVTDIARNMATNEGLSWNDLTPSEQHGYINKMLHLIGGAVLIFLGTSPALAGIWVAFLIVMFTSETLQLENSIRELQ